MVSCKSWKAEREGASTPQGPSQSPEADDLPPGAAHAHPHRDVENGHDEAQAQPVALRVCVFVCACVRACVRTCARAGVRAHTCEVAAIGAGRKEWGTMEDHKQWCGSPDGSKHTALGCGALFFNIE